VGPKTAPANKFQPAERARALKVVNAPEHRDLSPKQIVPQLADQGEYIGSESTLYRILREEDQMKHREPSRPPSKPHKPDEHVATGPNQVWSWDITYLRTPIRGLFFYLYVVMDIWSRKIVGWTIETEESAEHAEAMIGAACEREGVGLDQLVIHSDNGAPMKALTLLAFFRVLGILPSYSRPAVSNDNPYSESLFRTTKYRPQFPRRPFASVQQAREWMTWFVHWYNETHRHSAIKFVTPEQRHTGQDVAILARRQDVYEAAKARNPNRWTGPTRDWTHVRTVVLNPNKTISQLSTEVA
jgi:transposase InsO family protein